MLVPERYRKHVVSVGSLYGLQIATLVIPLVLLPFLTRRLGPDVWGVLAVQTSLSTLMIVIMEFGFGFGATREAAAVRGDRRSLGLIVSDLIGARVLLGVFVGAVWATVWFAVPIVRAEPAAYWWTLALTVVQGLSPSWFFQALGRLPYVMVRELAARVTSLVLIIAVVHVPEDAWLVPFLQFLTIAGALTLSSRTMLKLVDAGSPDLTRSVRMLRLNLHLCLTRLVQGLAPMGNTFILGVLLPSGAPFYAASERTANAVRSLLAPVSQVAFPEVVVLMAQDAARATVVVRRILLALLAGAATLALGLWLAADVVIHVLFGQEFNEAVPVFRLLVASVPLFAIVQVVGLQWLLPLKYDRPFLYSTIAGAALNIAIGVLLVPHLGASGMAWALLISEASLAVGLLAFTEFVGPDALRIFRRPRRAV